MPRRSDAWEINRAYEAIREAFKDQPHSPSRLGLKSGAYIEAAFISPTVGRRYQNLLSALEKRTGWEIRVRASSNQEQIAQTARSLTPDACVVRGSPKIFPDRVVVPVVHMPEETELRQIAGRFEEATGFAIAWEAPPS